MSFRIESRDAFVGLPCILAAECPVQMNVIPHARAEWLRLRLRVDPGTLALPHSGSGEPLHLLSGGFGSGPMRRGWPQDDLQAKKQVAQSTLETLARQVALSVLLDRQVGGGVSSFH